MYRTISYWDLEDFSFISVSLPEANPVRRILFHPNGDVMFSGSQDSLKVHEWEPSNQLDSLPISWGKISDMQISGDQLVRGNKIFCISMGVRKWLLLLFYRLVCHLFVLLSVYGVWT